MANYFRKRAFLFVHHYSGAERDVLSEAINEEAVRQKIKVKTVSVDKEAGSGDLAEDEPYNQHLDWARRGFPCTTYSRLRCRAQDGTPTPVRSKLHPYTGYRKTMFVNKLNVPWRNTSSQGYQHRQGGRGEQDTLHSFGTFQRLGGPTRE